MKTILAAAIGSLLLASTAHADDSLMASRFGNTTIAKTKGGTEAHLYYNADHTFTGKVINPAITLKGTWTIDGNNVCMTYTPAPFGVKNPQCTLLEAHQVGDSWVSGTRSVSLVAGIQ